jgi:hypothetical protein
LRICAYGGAKLPKETLKILYEIVFPPLVFPQLGGIHVWRSVSGNRRRNLEKK